MHMMLFTDFAYVQTSNGGGGGSRGGEKGGDVTSHLSWLRCVVTFAFEFFRTFVFLFFFSFLVRTFSFCLIITGVFS